MRVNRYHLALLILTLAAVIHNYIFFCHDSSVAGVDSQNHLLFSLEFYRSLTRFAALPFSFPAKIIGFLHIFNQQVPSGSCYWPNGLNLGAAFFYALLGPSLLAAKCALLPYLALLLISVYSLGRRVDDDATGLLSSFLVMMYPHIFLSSRQYQLDFPLTAMVAACLAMLAASDYFANRRASLILGLLLGWGMHIKGQILIFIVPAASVYLIGGLRELDSRARRAWLRTGAVNVLLCAGISLIIGSGWWLKDIPDLLRALNAHTFSPSTIQETPVPSKPRLSWPVLSAYAASIYFTGLKPFLCALFLWAGAVTWRRRFLAKSLLLSVIGIPFLLFMFVFSVKHARFFMPFFPAMAVITALALRRVRRLRGGIITVIALLCVAQFALLSYADKSLRKRLPQPLPLLLSKNSYGSDYEINAPLRTYDFGLDRVRSCIAAHTAGRPRAISLCLIHCAPSPPGLFECIYRLSLEDERFLVHGLVADGIREFNDELRHCNFLVVLSCAQNPVSWPQGELFMMQMQRYRPGELAAFQEHTPEIWQHVLRQLDNLKPDFRLIATITDRKSTTPPLQYAVFQNFGEILKSLRGTSSEVGIE